MQASRGVLFAERVCLTILFAWLAWLPLPFGSVVARARLPLLAIPFALCTAAAIIRLYTTRDRTNTAQPTPAWKFWGFGTLILIAVAALQLIPLPPGTLRALSPEAHAIWSAGSQIATLGGAHARTSWTLTVDPAATQFEILRMAALFAAFTTAALLIRTHTRRRVLAIVLCLAALFQALYGLREAALQRYEIWGWVNRLIFHRVTGTFVNPNHFAHYIAIVLPMTFFLTAALWRKTGDHETPAARRFAALIERHALMAGFIVLTVVACLAGILLAQSRGTIVAIGAACLAVAAMLPGRRFSRILAGATAGLVLLVTLALFLGTERTVERFAPQTIEQNAEGRRGAIAAAASLWRRFPIFGAGYGTFPRIVSMEQQVDADRIYHHAHNDYLELGATGGTVGFAIAMCALVLGYAALVRMTFGPRSGELTTVRRAFQIAALLSITIALVHALFDFNFYIPANPSTLVVIAGAAVASIDHDKRTRR
jgi:O-antigen ligase